LALKLLRIVNPLYGTLHSKTIALKIAALTAFDIYLPPQM